MPRKGRGWWKHRRPHSVAAREGWRNRSRSEKVLDLQKAITRRLYGRDRGKKEVLTITYPKRKERKFAFLERPPEELDAGGTTIRAKGYWQGKHSKKVYIDDNVLHEIEFKDSKDDKVGRELMDLLKEYNEQNVGEALLYAKTTPVSESSLSPMESSKKKLEKIVSEKI